MAASGKARALVTGGAGFIGSHVVDAYIQAGLDVAIVDSLATGSRANVNPAARLYEVDIRDGEALDRVFATERPDVVSHQAAQASVRGSMEDPPRDAAINVLGSINVLEAARKHGARKVIYAATGGAAVGEPKYLPVDEDHPVAPLSPYGASKHAVEHYVALYNETFGLDTTVLRYTNIYGPRQDPRGEAGVIAIFAGLMLTGGQPIVNGTGEQERDYVYVGDVARANLLALDRGSSRMFNIGTGVSTSVNGLFDMLAELTGYGEPRQHGPALSGEVFRIFVTNDRARDELGWQPTVELHEGLRLTVESIRAKLAAQGGA
ncbi:MAG TPA: NAD-dependent epimerase/dehydratase family protein [Chloroflexota bacterium]|nr:NAD-dependent epimerase/dehydratase family protein [Chloroflexota bacterium]